MLKRIVMSVLVIFSLSACSTMEIVHAELKLPCMPEHGVTFKSGETAPMSDELYSKFEKIIITYKKRIELQCRLAEQHNQLHESK